MDRGEEIVVASVKAGGDGSEVFEFVEEALDEVAASIEEGAEGENDLLVAHGFDAGPGATLGETGAHGVAVIGAVGQQDIALAKPVQHVGGRAPVMGLSFCQLEHDRQAQRVDQRVDLRRQAAARTTHATGSAVFLGVGGELVNTDGRGSIIWMTPS